MPESRSNYLDIQGHRGARGLYPENTLTGFLEALKLGVTTLELDVVISGDNKVVVSHEPWTDPRFCFFSDGRRIEDGKKNNFFRMKYSEIASFDCGMYGHPEFPLQKHISEHKPLLREVLLETQAFSKSVSANITYNIEIKSESEDEGVFYPSPVEFVKSVWEVIKEYRVEDQCILQSFDKRILQEIKKQKIKVRTGLLVEDVQDPELHLKQLGFLPEYYNPEFNLVTKYLVGSFHARDIKIIPWTVNEVSDMEKLIADGVDGLITDYPDKALDLVRERKKNKF